MAMGWFPFPSKEFFYPPLKSVDSIESLIVSCGYIYLPDAYLPQDGNNYNHYRLYSNPEYAVRPDLNHPAFKEKYFFFNWSRGCRNHPSRQFVRNQQFLLLNQDYTYYGGVLFPHISFPVGCINDGQPYYWIQGTNLAEFFFLYYVKLTVKGNDIAEASGTFYSVTKALPEDCDWEGVTLHFLDWLVKAYFFIVEKQTQNFCLFDPNRPDIYEMKYLSLFPPLNFYLKPTRLKGSLFVYFPCYTWFGSIVNLNKEKCHPYWLEKTDYYPLFRVAATAYPHNPNLDEFLGVLQIGGELDANVFSDFFDYLDFSSLTVLKKDWEFNNKELNVFYILQRFDGKKGYLLVTPYSHEIAYEHVEEYFLPYPPYYVKFNLLRIRELKPTDFKQYLPQGCFCLRLPMRYHACVINDLGGFAGFTAPEPFNVDFRFYNPVPNLPQYALSDIRYSWCGGKQNITAFNLNDRIDKSDVIFKSGQTHVKIRYPLMQPHVPPSPPEYYAETPYKAVDYELGGEIVKWFYGK